MDLVMVMDLDMDIARRVAVRGFMGDEIKGLKPEAPGARV